MNIENPMVLNQEQYDVQMQPYEQEYCNYCEEYVNKHHVKKFGDLHICVDCEAKFLQECAGRMDFDDFVAKYRRDYLLDWWWGSLSDYEKEAILSDAYNELERLFTATGNSALADDRAAFCSSCEENFVDFLRERQRWEP